MFQRRTPLTFLQHTRQMLWPKMGWWRLIKYYRYRVVRLSSSTQSIAANLAGGSAMSLTPFFGIHIFGAMAFAWLIGARMNIVAAVVGTFIGNPWTFPFFIFAEYSLGTWVLNLFDTKQPDTQMDPDIVAEHSDSFFTFLYENFSDIFIPTAVGGAILAIISFPIFYVFYFYVVRGAQRARQLRLKRKQRALFNKKAKGDKRS